MTSREISRISFTQANLNWFAEQSGDWNPIHVNPLAARRLLAGDVIVHGMYTLLWALESCCAHQGAAPEKIAVRFHRPVLCGETIELHLEEVSSTEVRLLAYNRQEVVATIRAEGSCRLQNQTAPERPAPQRSEPVHLQFAQLKGLAGNVALQAHPDQLNLHFPHLVQAMGMSPLAAIMATSRVVGMLCPGLSSLYSGAEFELVPDARSTALQWQVVRHTIVQAPVRIKVNGGGVAGYLDVFVRPEPVAQPTLAEIATQVEPEACKGQVAWVIGGSRGLGELVSKMIAAGGGHVIMTYHKGRQDAERIAAEFAAQGDKGEIFQLDVHDPASIANLIRSVRTPTHIYFFASTRITRPRHAVFDEALFGEFLETYVNALARLVTAVRGATAGPLKVFYPSTVFIDDLPKEFPEYVSAKSAGETLCIYLSKQLPNLDILVKRLPRLPTDQTSGLIKVAISDPVAQLLPVVREMSMSLPMKANDD